MPEDLEVTTGRIVRRGIERGLSVACLAMGLEFVLLPDVFAWGLFAGMAWLLPQAAWGLLFFGIGTCRLLVLIVNGVWPVGPRVRLGLSLATAIGCWFPLLLSAWYYAAGDAPAVVGHLSLAIILAPLVLWCEAMCMVALRAWIEAH